MVVFVTVLLNFRTENGGYSKITNVSEVFSSCIHCLLLLVSMTMYAIFE